MRFRFCVIEDGVSYETKLPGDETAGGRSCRGTKLLRGTHLLRKRIC